MSFGYHRAFAQNGTQSNIVVHVVLYILKLFQNISSYFVKSTAQFENRVSRFAYVDSLLLLPYIYPRQPFSDMH